MEMGPNELKNLTLFVEVKYIFIFSIQFLFYIYGVILEHLKTSFSGYT